MSKRRHQKKAPDKKAFQPKLTLEEWLQKGKTFDLFLTDVLCPGHLWPALDAPDPALDVQDAPDSAPDVQDAPDSAPDVQDAPDPALDAPVLALDVQRLAFLM